MVGTRNKRTETKVFVPLGENIRIQQHFFRRGFEGLGYVIVDSTGLFNAPKAWLALIAIGATGIAWYLIVEVMERLVLPWEAAGRRQD